MGMTTTTPRLTDAEEAFLQALLWEEVHLVKGPATREASEHSLSLLRVLEVANRLSPNLYGAPLARIQEGPRPSADWPWSGLKGPEVLHLLWERLRKAAHN
jgi:hypothetical protein